MQNPKLMTNQIYLYFLKYSNYASLTNEYTINVYLSVYIILSDYNLAEFF